MEIQEAFGDLRHFQVPRNKHGPKHPEAPPGGGRRGCGWHPRLVSPFFVGKNGNPGHFFSLFPLLLDKLHPLDLRQALPLADFCLFLPILAPRFLAESVLGWQKTAGRSEMESGSCRERAAFVKSRGDLLPPSCKAAEKRSLQPAGNQITSSSSPLRP